MGFFWIVHIRTGSERLAKDQTSLEFCHTPRSDETQILRLQLKSGEWRRFDCRVVGIVNTETRQEVTVDILCEASPSVV